MAINQYYCIEADSARQIYFKKDPVLEETSHFHDSVEFIFVLDGEVKVSINDREAILTKGDISFAESYQTHCYKITSKPFLAIVLVLSREHIKCFRDIYPTRTFDNFMLDKEKNKELFSLVENWFDNKEQSYIYNVSCATMLFAALINNYPLIEKEDIKERSLLKDMLKYIHIHYNEDISLKTIAREFGYSMECCSKTLSKATKCNFRYYLNSLRIRKVKELMSDKTLSLNQNEIFRIAGFASAATYYRVKKEMNIGD